MVSASAPPALDQGQRRVHHVVAVQTRVAGGARRGLARGVGGGHRSVLGPLRSSGRLCNSVQDSCTLFKLATTAGRSGRRNGEPWPNPLDGVDTSNDPYVIVSSDTHAGLQVEEYRDYLDPQYLTRSSTSGSSSATTTADSSKRSTASTSRSGRARTPRACRGAFDPEVRDKELDADGIAGEVIFADGDSVTGQESPPFGAGLAAGQITDPALAFAGARAHNRWLSEFCATNPPRRAPAWRWCRSSTTSTESVREIESLAGTPGMQRDHDPDDVARPALVRAPRATTRCGRPAPRPGWWCTHTRARATGRPTTRTSPSSSWRCLLDPPPAVAAAVVGRLRSLPRTCATCRSSADRGGWATCCGRPTRPSAPTRRSRS